MINHVLGVIHPLGVFAGKAQLLGALSSRGNDDSAEADFLEIFDTKGFPFADHDVAEIRNLRMNENALKLLAQPGLHLLLVHEDAVLRQAAGLDVPIDQ
jgi:hypothetical protein